MRTIAGIISISIGSIILYRAGYKQITEIDGVSFIFVLFGWLAIIGGNSVIRKAKANGHNKFIKNFAEAAQIVGAVVITFAQMQYIQSLGLERIDQIISTKPTAITTGTIVEIDEYQKRITIEYPVNEKIIKQHQYFPSLPDYRIGQKIQLIYSVEYPDMFNTFK